jgi:triphosphoribosyl-dephospho-CoA synthase
MPSMQMQLSMRTCAPRYRAQYLAQLAREAMVAEAVLTPKPGLVDCRGAGSHSDLSLDLMLRSASAIEPFFAGMAELASYSEPCEWLREELAILGRTAETAMFLATEGANTHKGAIWIIGLLVAGAARRDGVPQIVEAASAIARIPDRQLPRLVTHGDAVRRRFGARGARGEAEDGFPHVMKYALPTLQRHLRAGAEPSIAQVNTLMAVMRHLEDTCVLFRGGRRSLLEMQRGAGRVLDAGGASTREGMEQLLLLDAAAKARGVSPGGSADLLAAAIFLNSIEIEGDGWAPAPPAERKRHGEA